VVISSNYKFVLGMVFTIAGSLFVYKSCTIGVPNISGLGTLDLKKPAFKPKVTTKVDTTTTIVSSPGGTTTTTIVDKTIVDAPRRLRIDIGIATDGLQPKAAPIYDLGVSYRIFDHVWVGGAVYSDKKVGLRVGVEL